MYRIRNFTAARIAVLGLLVASLALAGCGDKNPVGPTGDQQPHPEPRSLIVTVHGVDLHYIDWGGQGETLLFLAGLGNTAHIWTDFAPRFVEGHRVVALTRRGFGASDRPTDGYDTGALAADIIGFMDALGIASATLVGHSLAGDEMSRIAVEHPQRVEKLVYLDAAYDRAGLEAILAQSPQWDGDPPVIESWEDLIDYLRDHVYGFWADALEVDLMVAQEYPPAPWASAAIMAGSAQAAPDYSNITAAALAIYSIEPLSQYLPADASDEYSAAMTTWYNEFYIPYGATQRQRFGNETANASVVELADTHHYSFLQKSDEVYRLMAEFLGD